MCSLQSKRPPSTSGCCCFVLVQTVWITGTHKRARLNTRMWLNHPFSKADHVCALSCAHLTCDPLAVPDSEVVALMSCHHSGLVHAIRGVRAKLLAEGTRSYAIISTADHDRCTTLGTGIEVLAARCNLRPRYFLGASLCVRARCNVKLRQQMPLRHVCTRDGAMMPFCLFVFRQPARTMRCRWRTHSVALPAHCHLACQAFTCHSGANTELYRCVSPEKLTVCWNGVPAHNSRSVAAAAMCM
jgi:hypothetical protein